MTQYEEILQLAAASRLDTVLNSRPELGLSHTVRLGLSRLEDCDGAAFLVADQPFLTAASLTSLVELWRGQPQNIAAFSHDGVRGNPCLFPSRFFPALLQLTGDQGGSAVIRAHPEAVTLLEVSPQELWDIDTREALEALSLPPDVS